MANIQMSKIILNRYWISWEIREKDSTDLYKNTINPLTEDKQRKILETLETTNKNTITTPLIKKDMSENLLTKDTSTMKQNKLKNN